MNLDKEQVAARQLDTAIRLMFDGGDIVSVHTLASASSTIFSDLLHASGSTSWWDDIIKSYPGGEKAAIQILREAQNFFKHADKDPNEEIDFEEVTNDETIIIATLEYGELLKMKKMSRKKLTTPMSVFQVWYFAKTPDVLLMSSNERGKNMAKHAQTLFPNLKTYPRVKQLAAGTEELLNREMAK